MWLQSERHLLSMTSLRHGLCSGLEQQLSKMIDNYLLPFWYQATFVLFHDWRQVFLQTCSALEVWIRCTKYFFLSAVNMCKLDVTKRKHSSNTALGLFPLLKCTSVYCTVNMWNMYMYIFVRYANDYTIDKSWLCVFLDFALIIHAVKLKLKTVWNSKLFNRWKKYVFQ